MYVGQNEVAEGSKPTSKEFACLLSVAGKDRVIYSVYPFRLAMIAGWIVSGSQQEELQAVSFD